MCLGISRRLGQSNHRRRAAAGALSEGFVTDLGGAIERPAWACPSERLRLAQQAMSRGRVSTVAQTCPADCFNSCILILEDGGMRRASLARALILLGPSVLKWASGSSCDHWQTGLKILVHRMMLDALWEGTFRCPQISPYGRIVPRSALVPTSLGVSGHRSPS